MERSPAISDKHQAGINRRGRQNMLFERGGPNEPVGGNIARPGSVDAFQPGVIFSPPKVAAPGEVNAILMKDRHAIKIARTFAAVEVVLVDVGFWRFGIKIKFPHSIQPADAPGLKRRAIVPRCRFLESKWLEGISNSVAGGEKDQRLPLHFPKRWG